MIAARGLKAIGYVRVSTDEQAREGLSLDLQVARIGAYCEAKGWELLRVYRDAGISGKDLERPGIQSLLHDLKGNGVDVVVILKLDRLTRSIRDLGLLIDDLFEGVALASVAEGFDSSTAAGEIRAIGGGGSYGDDGGRQGIDGNGAPVCYGGLGVENVVGKIVPGRILQGAGYEAHPGGIEGGG